MDKKPRKRFNFTAFIPTGALSGKTGAAIVAAVVVICVAASACAVYAAWRVSEAVAAVANIKAPAEQSGEDSGPAKITQKTETEGGTAPAGTDTKSVQAPDAPARETGDAAMTQTSGETAAETETEPVDPGVPVICLDPGHGYDDPGADSEYLGDWSEKDITLDIALKIGTLLQDAGCIVYYTRSDDAIPADAVPNRDGLYLFNAYQREDYLNSLGVVDAFVSIHCDSYEQDSKINGAKVYYYVKNNKNTPKLSEIVAGGIKKALAISEGDGRTEPGSSGLYYDDAYYVTKCTAIPSVLVETGFVTNEKDAKNMLDNTWRQNMAQGIASGILSFLDQIGAW